MADPGGRVALDHAALLVGQVVDELAGVGAGLEADQVVLGEVRAELAVAGQRDEDLGGRERDVEEEAEPLAAP